MSDIFLSYDSADRERVRPLVELLHDQGWQVWWDRKISPGDTWDQSLASAIESSKCILIVWSNESVESRWVRKEAAEGDRRKKIVPMMIDECEIPFAFRDIQCSRMIGYPADVDERELGRLLESIGQLIDKPPEDAEAAVAEAVLASGEYDLVHKTDQTAPARAAAGIPARWALATLAALFVAFLFWQVGPFAASPPAVYSLRVTVVGPEGLPVEGVDVELTVGSEAKQTSTGWEFDIPAGDVPAGGAVTVFARKPSVFLAGSAELMLGADSNPAIIVTLEKDTSALIFGTVIDRQGTPVDNVRVSVDGYADESVVTANGGAFELPAHAAPLEDVLLRIEGEGFAIQTIYKRAGDTAHTIILNRENGPSQTTKARAT